MKKILKKKIILISSIIIFVIFLFGLYNNVHNYSKHDTEDIQLNEDNYQEDYKEKANNEINEKDRVKADKDNSKDVNTSDKDNKIEDSIETGELSEISTENTSIGGRLQEHGMTYKDKKIVFNQDLSSKYTIGFFLKYKIDSSLPISKYTVDIDTYIKEKKPKGTGLWIADGNLQGLEGSKSSRSIILDIFKQFGIKYSINSEGFINKNNSDIEICKYANEIISSDKLVMIGFSPLYYVYIQGQSNTVSSADLLDTYTSFEPIDNIYPYVIKEGCKPDELQEILKQICKDIEK